MDSNCLRLASVAAESPRRAASMVLKIRSVTPPTAETTTIILALPAARLTMSAHCRNRSEFPTEVPPNFITIKGRLSIIVSFLVSWHKFFRDRCAMVVCGGEQRFCVYARPGKDLLQFIGNAAFIFFDKSNHG